MRQRGIETPRPTIYPGCFEVQVCSEFLRSRVLSARVVHLLTGKKIVLIGYNHRDGIGDFVNLLDIQALISGSCPEVNIMAVIAIVGEDKFKTAQRIIQERGEPENLHIFMLTQWETSQVDQVSSQFPSSAEHHLFEAYKTNGLDKIIQDCDFVMNVATRSVGCVQTVQRFNLNVPILSIGELGFRQQFNSRARELGGGRFPIVTLTDRFAVAMGFSKQDVGVKIKMPPLLEDNGLSGLQSINQKMNGNILLENSVETYFQKTRLAYGYLQENIWFFISLIALECRGQQEIQYLDFFLPITLFTTSFLKKRSENCIESIIYELQGKHEAQLIEYGIKELQVFVCGESIKVNLKNVSEGKILRIFDTNQFSEDERLTLRFLSSKMLGGSGDTSILDALFNSHLPFIEVRQWKHAFIRDLIEFVEKYADEPLLTSYFKLMEGLFFPPRVFDHNSVNLMDEVGKSLNGKALLIIGIALAESGDVLRAAWKRCVLMIKESRNLEHNMPYILLQTVVRSHPQVIILEDLCYTSACDQKIEKILLEECVVERFLEIALQIFEGKSQITFENFPEVAIEYEEGKAFLVDYVLKGESVFLDRQKLTSYTLNPNLWFKPFREKEENSISKSEFKSGLF